MSEVDLDAVLNEKLGVGLGAFGAGMMVEEQDPLAAWFNEGLFDMPVVTHVEPGLPERRIPKVGIVDATPDVTVTDVTGRDVFQSYMDAPEAVRQALHERLFTAGFYPRTHPPDAIHRPVDARNAFERATAWYMQEGKTPVEALPAADKSLFVEEEEGEPAVRRATEAQVGAMVDQMARSLLGRKASQPERNAAVAIARRFEDAGQSFGPVDFEAPLRFVAGDEAQRQSVSRTLSMFDQIVKGR